MAGLKKTVERALRRYRNLAASNRWGGMADDYKLAKAALEALDALVEVGQRELIGRKRKEMNDGDTDEA